ncbi:MAG TPA: RHS repeat-associated core domain-containing protein [Polyangiaceae bacterium]
MRPLHVPIVSGSVPPNLSGIVLEIDVAGRTFSTADGTLPQLAIPTAAQLPYFYDFYWDGMDASGRSLFGAQPVHTHLGYTYPGVYQAVPVFGGEGTGTAITASRSRFDATLWQDWSGFIDRWDARISGLGGWDFDVHHAYDPVSGAIHLGDGEEMALPIGATTLTTVAGIPGNSVAAASQGAENVAGNTSALSLDTPVNSHGNVQPSNIAVAPDGTIYFSDTGNNRIRKVGTNGIISTVAGGGGSNTDGVPATSASLSRPSGLAIGPDAKLYIGDSFHNRIWVMDPTVPNPTITRFAGSSDETAGHADGPATSGGTLTNPAGLAFGPDGALYIADMEMGVRKILGGQLTTVVPFCTSWNGNTCNSTAAGASGQVSSVAVDQHGIIYFTAEAEQKVYRVDLATKVPTVYAGSSWTVNPVAPFGDGGPATSAVLWKPDSLAFGPDGLLYISDSNNSAIRRVRSDGVIETVAGNGVRSVAPSQFTTDPLIVDGLGPTRTALNFPHGVAVGPDGTLYIADDASQRIRASTSAVGSGVTSASSDGLEFYMFNLQGRHQQTVDGRTGVLKYAFRYDSNGLLIGISDRALTDNLRRETTIQRNAQGVPLSITAPDGQVTTLTVPSGAYLTSLTNPDGGFYSFDYPTAAGLLGHMSDPLINAQAGTPFAFAYEQHTTLGRLLTDTDPLGNSQSLAFSNLASGTGWRVTRKDQLLRPTLYDTNRPSPNTLVRSIQGPDLLTETTSINESGTPTFTAPGGALYSAVHSLPNGYSTYSQTDVSDPLAGARAPLTSSELEVMGTGTGAPIRATTHTRVVTRSDSADPTTLQSFNDQVTVNNRSTTLNYDAPTRTFTSLSPGGRKVTTIIDAFDRTVSTQVSGLTKTQFNYDPTTGKLSSIVLDDGVTRRETDYSYFPVSSAVQSGYMSGISYLLKGAALADSASYTRDAFGRPLTEVLGVTETSTLGWDRNGNLSSVQPPGDSSHGLAYDLLNQLKTYTPPARVSPPPVPVESTGYTYTADRKLNTRTNPDGVTTTWNYDATTGRLSSISMPSVLGTGNVATSYSYYASGQSAPGQIKSITGPYGIDLAFDYFASLPKSTTWSSVGLPIGSVQWAYDNDFAKISELLTPTAGASTAIQFGYDADKLLTCAEISATGCNTTDAGAMTVNRDAQRGGVITSITLGKLKETYGYNSYGELASKTTTFDTTLTPVLALTFDDLTAHSRDTLGRITRKTESLHGATATNYDYTYSAQGRLTTVKNSPTNTIESYGYAGTNGNRTSSLTVTSPNITYDPQDRLTKYGNFTYTYTKNGELKTKTDTTNSQVTTYTYDAQGNLITVAPPNAAPLITYITDGLNRRVAKKVGTSIVKQWLYRDSLKPVAELDGTGALVSTFVYGSSPNVPDYMVRGGSTYRILTDQVGSVRMVVDVSTGVSKWEATYSAFGEQTITVGAATPDFMPFGFAGGLYDVDTKLTRFGARDYDASVGRWTAKDPTRFSDGPSLYSYAHNDPVNMRDRTGRNACSITAGVGGTMVCALVCLETGPACGVVCSLVSVAAGELCPPDPDTTPRKKPDPPPCDSSSSCCNTLDNYPPPPDDRDPASDPPTSGYAM